MRFFKSCALLYADTGIHYQKCQNYGKAKAKTFPDFQIHYLHGCDSSFTVSSFFEGIDSGGQSFISSASSREHRLSFFTTVEKQSLVASIELLLKSKIDYE
jgi:hypothetical protein